MSETSEDYDGVKVTRAQALREVRKHGASEAEFLAEVGDKPEYDGFRDVLQWLGY